MGEASVEQNTVSGADIEAAAARLQPLIRRTPLERQATLSQLTGEEVYVKLENFQKTGSFKIRGAFNKILRLNEAERRRGVIAASAGNHAQGVAYAAQRAGLRALIVMPRGAAVSKVAATKEYGAEVVLVGDTYDDASAHAQGLAAERGLTFIHAFDDPAVIAGQGTIGLEILADLPDVDVIVVPVGGGGLISGIALAARAAAGASGRRVRVIGVQAAGAPSMARSQAGGRPITLDDVHTIADGIAVKRPGGLTYSIVRQTVDELVTVDDEAIAAAILLFVERLKLVVEGAGAAAAAAVLSGKVRAPGQRVAVVASGGNIDVDMIARIIDRGLVAAFRRLRLRVGLSDRPGSLHRLTGVIAAADGNILGIEHDRTNTGVPIGATEVTLSLAVQNKSHGEALIRALEESGYGVQVV